LTAISSATDQGLGATPGSLPRVLGFWDVVTITIAAIIGVGIFFTPAAVVDRAGSGGVALLVWLGGGILALMGALTFAELGAMLPKVGGQFAVLREAFGARVGFVSVASVTLTVQAGALGILALLCAGNVFLGLGLQSSEGRITAGALAVVLLVWAINVAGVRLSAGVLRANVAVKLLTIFAIVALAAFSTRPAEPGAFAIVRWPGAHVFVYALIPTLFSFGGFEQVLWTAGEIRNPGKNLARGILVGVVTVIVAYASINVAFLALLGPERVARDQFVTARAVESVAPRWAFLAALAVAVSALGTTQAILLTAPRQIVALARDRLVPRLLGSISGRTGTPVPATTLIAATAAVLILTSGGVDGLGALLDAVICVNWIFFGLTAVALLVLRRTRPELPRPFRVPLYPLTPVLFAAAAFAAAASPFFQEGGRKPAIISCALVLTLGLLSRLWIRSPRLGTMQGRESQERGSP
jgi:amino acid transporter